VVGFSSDLLTEIARTVNVKIQLVEADPDTMTALLDTGQVDGILTALPDDTMNERYFEFTLPYFVSGTVVVVAANSPYTKLDDLKSVIIAYDYGAGVSSTVGAKSTWMLKPYESVSRALDDVVAGGVDGMVLNYINASRLPRQKPRTHRVV
jgi:ABC-type amino acid transport substrate-binding protein